MTNTMTCISSLLEMLYFITAGPLLLILAFKGLDQLRIAKQASRINSKRESFKSAAEQCGVFGDRIVPLMHNFRKEVEQNNNTFFDSFDTIILDKGFKIKLKNEVKDSDVDLINASEHLTPLINSLEAYAVYFVSGVAAEQVGYITTGKSYCEIVEYLLPIVGPEMKKGHYKNLMILFFMWRKRLEMDRLRFEKREIERKLKEKGNGLEINPIGLDKRD